MTKARNIADLGSNDVIETTATGVDVTGTVTADGLTVDGNSNLGIEGSGSQVTMQLPSLSSSYPTRLVIEGDYNSGTSDVDIKAIGVPSGGPYGANLNFYTSSQTSVLNRMKIAANGDVSFYEDTGTTAKFVWDASAERLGIINSVGSDFSNCGFYVGEGASLGQQQMSFGYNSSGEYGYIQPVKIGSYYTDLALNPNGGNVGIGTSSPSNTLEVGGEGILRLRPSTDNTQSALYFNGTTTGGNSYRSDIGVVNDGGLYFSTTGTINTVPTERARITADGSFDLLYKNLGSIATYTETTYRHRNTFSNLYFNTPADNTWRNVCAMNDSYGTFTVTGSDTSSGDVAQYAYRITTVSYGVSMFSQVFYKEGGWNTGTFEFRVANVGGTQTLQMRYSSYYSSSNTGSFYINFNSLGY